MRPPPVPADRDGDEGQRILASLRGVFAGMKQETSAAYEARLKNPGLTSDERRALRVEYNRRIMSLLWTLRDKMEQQNAADHKRRESPGASSNGGGQNGVQGLGSDRLKELRRTALEALMAEELGSAPEPASRIGQSLPRV
jgi:hypothetical protein